MGSYFDYEEGDEPVPGHRVMSGLGRGGFGEVWKVKVSGGVHKALKAIDLTGQQGLREFKSLDTVKDLSHPHLVTIHGCWLKDKRGNVLTEESFVDEEERVHVGSGGPRTDSADPARPVELLIAMDLGEMNLYVLLEKYKKQREPGIPVEELLGYMDDVAKGIDYLNEHQPPIIHGDIKPHNLLLVSTSVKICDYGMCKAIESARSAHTQTQTPVTLAYAPPELFDRHPHPRSDQYSLAITYVELRTGELPFDGESQTSAMRIMRAHETGRLDFSRLSSGVLKVMRRATAINPLEVVSPRRSRWFENCESPKDTIPRIRRRH